MTSVCTGALVYADAGLLDGRPATTYWNAFDELLPLGRESPHVRTSASSMSVT
jgi:transcriptional regulator GlxA family with amidase domain